jgi:hypothetical protein
LQGHRLLPLLAAARNFPSPTDVDWPFVWVEGWARRVSGEFPMTGKMVSIVSSHHPPHGGTGRAAETIETFMRGFGDTSETCRSHACPTIELSTDALFRPVNDRRQNPGPHSSLGIICREIEALFEKGRMRGQIIPS